MAVTQERGCLFDCPTWTLDAARQRDGCVAGGIVGQPALADRVVQGAGQRGDAPAHGDWATATGQLGADELVDVLVGEAFQPDRTEGRQQIVVQIVVVSGHGGRLELPGLSIQPADQVVRDGLRVVDVDAGPFAFRGAGDLPNSRSCRIAGVV